MPEGRDNVVPIARARAATPAAEGAESRAAQGGASALSADGVEQLREALRGLRQEIEGRLEAAEEVGETFDASFDWMELFDELRHRLGTLGMVERSGEVDEFGLDAVALLRARTLLDFLVDRYWRIDLYGAEKLPEEGPALFVANHSGLLPWDGLVFAHRLVRERPHWPRPRFLVADWLVTLPFVQPTLARVGGVRACRENADRLLSRGKSVLAFPEGVRGAAKVFRDRYRLQRFGRGGAVRSALENRVPLIPVGIVGAEEAHPVIMKSRLGGRLLGLPFVPVTPTFPAFGPLGFLPLPTKWSIELGEPLDLGEVAPDAANDELLVSRLNEELREKVRLLLDRGLARRDSVWG